jgi:ribosomal-protein-alanine N-acetyltransferase
MIETERLHLIPFEADHADALERGPSELGALLGVAIPDAWPQFPEAYAVQAGTIRDVAEVDRNSQIWGTYLFLLEDRSSLVGSGGYKGKPSDGVVEIGYEIAPGFRNRGLATEATQAMIDHAFAYAEVDAVVAHTLPEFNASTRVLEKSGMVFVDTVTDPDAGTVWQWRVARSSSKLHGPPT